ncbi:MAG: PEP-CTERM sorting domain-containing protein [Verrucomicrobiota bacterium]
MNHSLISSIALCSTALLTVAPLAEATTLGLFSGSFVTTWDGFVDGNGATAGISINDAAPNSSSVNYTAALNVTMPAGSVTGGGDRLYSGSGASSNPFSFNITGTTTISTPLSLVLKFGNTNAITDFSGYFDVTLNGLASSPAVLANTSSESVNGTTMFHIYRYDFGTLPAGTPFTFNVTSDAGHMSLDSIQIIPEPSTLLAGMMGMGLLLRRRRN